MAKHNLEAEPEEGYELVQVISEERGKKTVLHVLISELSFPTIGYLAQLSYATMPHLRLTEKRTALKQHYHFFSFSLFRTGDPRQRQRLLCHEHLSEL